MKENKVLLAVSSLEQVTKYEKLGITNFLFPLIGYSIGYEAFTLEEIGALGVNAYILVNRILTDDDIDEFLKLEIPDNVKGFMIEDTGLYYELKGSKYTLINFQNHLNNNYKTINYWLQYFDSVALSTDITKEEVNEILKKARKPLVVTAVGYPMIMYSRRHLVTNYYKHLDLEEKKEIEIKESKSNIDFRLKESSFGTAVFDNHLIDIRDELKSMPNDKILFYLINTQFLSEEDILKAIKGEKIENTTKGFLDKKTVYRVGDLK